MFALNPLYKKLNKTGFLKSRLRKINAEILPLGSPIQGAFNEPNLISILGLLPLAQREKLINQNSEPGKSSFSIRDIDGVSFGKPPHPDLPVLPYSTFRDYASKLGTAAEYSKPNRIGFETDEDFKANCEWIDQYKKFITGYDDNRGLVIIRHEWDGKCYIDNGDGAHHFAAIYRQCMDQSRNFTFECSINEQSLNKPYIGSLIDRYHHILLMRVDLAKALEQLYMEFRVISPFYVSYQPGENVLFAINKVNEFNALFSDCFIESTDPGKYFDLSKYLPGKMPQ